MMIIDKSNDGIANGNKNNDVGQKDAFMPSPRIAPRSFEEYLYSKRKKDGDKGKPFIKTKKKQRPQSARPHRSNNKKKYMKNNNNNKSKQNEMDLYVSKIVNNTNNNNSSSNNNNKKNMKNDNNHDDLLINDMSQTSEILRDQAFEEYKKIKQDDV